MLSGRTLFPGLYVCHHDAFEDSPSDDLRRLSAVAMNRLLHYNASRIAHLERGVLLLDYVEDREDLGEEPLRAALAHLQTWSEGWSEGLFEGALLQLAFTIKAHDLQDVPEAVVRQDYASMEEVGGVLEALSWRGEISAVHARVAMDGESLVRTQIPGSRLLDAVRDLRRRGCFLGIPATGGVVRPENVERYFRDYLSGKMADDPIYFRFKSDIEKAGVSSSPDLVSMQDVLRLCDLFLPGAFDPITEKSILLAESKKPDYPRDWRPWGDKTRRRVR